MTMMKANTSSMNVLKACRKGNGGEGKREGGREGKEEREVLVKRTSDQIQSIYQPQLNSILTVVSTDLVHKCPPWQVSH